MISYFNQTQSQWLQLFSIYNGWNNWLSEGMTVDTQAQIFNQIAMDAAPQQSLLAPPVPNGNNPSAIPNWFHRHGFLFE